MRVACALFEPPRATWAEKGIISFSQSQLFRNRRYELLVLWVQRRPVPGKRAQYFGGFTIEFAPVVVLMPADRGRRTLVKAQLH
jgi:hypothetical protein